MAFMVCPVIVFAKAPEPGKVKTRLIPLLGEEGAAALHARLVQRALSVACAADTGPVELACTPDTEHPFFRNCAERYRVTLARQSDGDLGIRMHEACLRAFGHSGAALIIGADCPALTAEHLRAGRDVLAQSHEAVLVPAEDGGYVLIGLKRCNRRLFEAIDWGGPNVMAETRSRLSRLGWNWFELPALWDVDRPEDYERLVASGLLDGQQTLV
jgi:uncharacterized protein